MVFLLIEAANPNSINVVSISNGMEDEGYMVTHHVVLESATIARTTAKLYILEGEDTPSGDENIDINHRPILPQNFSMDDDNNIIIPEGIKEFDLKIQLSGDLNPYEYTENYYIVFNPLKTPTSNQRFEEVGLDYRKNVIGIGVIYNNN